MRYYILIVSMLTVSSVLTSAYADELKCEQFGEGWALKNTTKNFVFGGRTTVIYSKAQCERARETLRIQDSGLGVVCGPKIPDFDIYTLDGRLLQTVSYKTDPKYCFKSLAYMTDWVACLPSRHYQGGFEAFDLKEKFKRVGNGFYYSLNDCIWSSASARPEDQFICGPKDTYSVIYNRVTNKPVTNQRFSTIQACYRSLRGDY